MHPAIGAFDSGSVTHGEYFALLRLRLGGVRQDDSTGGARLRHLRAYDDPIIKRHNFHKQIYQMSGGRRPIVSLPRR